MTVRKVSQHERARRVAATVPQFKYFRYTETLVKVVCTRCANTFVVEAVRWRDYSTQPTRSCPFCFKVSRIHKETKEN